MSSSSPLLSSLVAPVDRAAASGWGASSRCGCVPVRASVPSTRPPPPDAISSRCRATPRSQPRRLGDSIPIHTAAHRRKGRRGGEAKGESDGGATPTLPLKPEAARGDPGRREVPHLDAAPPLLPLPAPPTSSSPHRAFLHRCLHLRVTVTVGERTLIPSLRGARPSSQSCDRPRARCRVAIAPSCCVMPAIEPGWDIFSCRCHSRPARAPRLPSFLSCSAPRSTGCCVAAVDPAVAMAVASTHARTRLRSQPRACAPTHVHAFARGGVKPDPFIHLSLDRSRARLRSVAVSRGTALRGTLLPRWCECRVVPELARLFSCLHAWTAAG
jgi:hypothetical protein